MTPETCPNCGADVPPRAKACPECGADEETGWNDRADTQRLGISDPDDFDHDQWQREEFGDAGQPRRLAWYWIAAAALVLLGLLWWAIPR